MLRKKYLFVVMVLVLLVAVAGCKTVAEKWESLTPDEKARVVIDDFQTQLDNLFHAGKTYVDAHPEAVTVWKQRIVPAFSTANKTLAHLISLAQLEELTPDAVYDEMGPWITEITALLVQLGAIT